MRFWVVKALARMVAGYAAGYNGLKYIYISYFVNKVFMGGNVHDVLMINGVHVAKVYCMLSEFCLVIYNRWCTYCAKEKHE